jgi:hypothetical protein
MAMTLSRNAMQHIRRRGACQPTATLGGSAAFTLSLYSSLSVEPIRFKNPYSEEIYETRPSSLSPCFSSSSMA